MSDEKYDPLQIMWTDPITVAEFWKSLPEDDRILVEKCLEPVTRGLNNSFDAVMGKDAHPLARLFIVMAMNVSNQSHILSEAGFEVDEIGCPVEDNDGEDEIEGDLEGIPDEPVD